MHTQMVQQNFVMDCSNVVRGSEGALAYSSILYLHVIFNRLTTKAGKVNTKGNKPLGVTTSM